MSEHWDIVEKAVDINNEDTLDLDTKQWVYKQLQMSTSSVEQEELFSKYPCINIKIILFLSVSVNIFFLSLDSW